MYAHIPGFMNARNRGAHIAPPQYGHEHLEEQNEEDEKALHADVLKLKSLSIDIGAEIRDQNKGWNEIDDQFESTSGQLLHNIQRVVKLAKSGSRYHLFYLFLFILFVVFVLWWQIK